MEQKTLAEQSFDELDRYLNLKTVDKNGKVAFLNKNSNEIKKETPRFSLDKDLEAKCFVYEKKWLNAKSLLNGISSVDYSSHSCYSSECLKKRRIVELESHIYQCTISGKIHVCSEKGLGCKDFIETIEGNLVCLLSGRDIGVVDKEEITTWDHSVPQKFQKTGEKTDSLVPDGRRRRKGNPSSKIDADSKSENNKNGDCKSRGRKEENEKNAGNESRFILKTLAFNFEKRHELNYKKVDRIFKKYENLSLKYVKKNAKNHQPFMAHEISSLYLKDLNVTQFLPYVINTERNLNKVEYYSVIVETIWLLVKVCPLQERTQKKIPLRQFVLGCLYLMKESHDFDNQSTNWLSRVLPVQSDLPIFSMRSQDVTKGVNFVKSCLTSYKDTSFEETPSQAFIDIHKKWYEKISEDIDEYPLKRIVE